MSVQTYDVQRWGVTSTHSQNYDSSPILYISPDSSLMSTLRNNDFTAQIKISGSLSPYNHLIINAKAYPAENIAGYRPNFQAQTGWIALVPDIKWRGYPTHNGKVHILITDEHTPLLDELENTGRPARVTGDGIAFILLIVAMVSVFIYIVQK